MQLLKKMLVAYKDRLKKESRQVEYYRQLRILNPQNLPDMPHATDQYPLLGLSHVQDIAEQWSLYIRCNAIDMNGRTALQEWWQSRAPSPFQERVLFLITRPTFRGEVEHFFSHCLMVSKPQHNWMTKSATFGSCFNSMLILRGASCNCAAHGPFV